MGPVLTRQSVRRGGCGGGLTELKLGVLGFFGDFVLVCGMLGVFLLVFFCVLLLFFNQLFLGQFRALCSSLAWSVTLPQVTSTAGSHCVSRLVFGASAAHTNTVSLSSTADFP